MDKIKIIVISGPTASGKSAIAAKLAAELNGEIVSADSVQVYRRLDIGTAKPPMELRAMAAHHLIDIVEPECDYTAARFMDDADEAIADIRARGKNAFVAGGTGLYIRALLHGIFDGGEADKDYRDELVLFAASRGGALLHARLNEVDPAAAAAIHPNNTRRVIRALEVYHATKKPISAHHREHGFSRQRYDALKIGLSKDRAALYADIDRRVDEMISLGLLDETRSLLNAGYSPGLRAMNSLGYKEMIGYIQGLYPFDEAVRLIKRNTRHYAKRQLTWFRKDPDIRWFNPAQFYDIMSAVRRHIG